MVNTKGELIYQHDVVSDCGFASKILEISDIFLKSIIGGSVREVGGFLNEYG